MKQWTVTGIEKGFDGLVYGDVEVPKVGENEVLVKMNGASLNYRDLIIPKVGCLHSGANNSAPRNRPPFHLLYRHADITTGTVPIPHQIPCGSVL